MFNNVVCLSFTELQTVLAETETIVNSRPLNELDENDLEEPLTPNHLLFGRKLNLRNTNENANLNDNVELSKRHKYLQTVIEHFWIRWRKEYLNTLRQYKVFHRPRGELIRVNDIVLIYDDKLPRHNWRLGRVQELIGTRGAKVFVGKTRNSITRPVNRLYPVETFKEEAIVKRRTRAGGV